MSKISTQGAFILLYLDALKNYLLRILRKNMSKNGQISPFSIIRQLFEMGARKDII